MSVQSAPYYWLVCDGCGAKSTEGSDFAAWGDAGQAEDDAVDYDWHLGGRTGYRTRQFEGERGETVTTPGNEGHYCPNCTPPWCLECERPITEENPRVIDKDGDPDNWECKGFAGLDRRPRPGRIGAP